VICWKKSLSEAGAFSEKRPFRKVSQVQDRPPGTAGGNLPNKTFCVPLQQWSSPGVTLGLSVGQPAVVSIRQAPPTQGSTPGGHCGGNPP